MQKRIEVLDYARGLLIIGMIIFHVFLNLSRLNLPELYFHPVSVGFVFCTGFLLSKVLLSKKTNSQIITRGLKLLMLFTLGNFYFWYLYAVPLREIVKFFVIGVPDFTLFEIMVPIAWVIILSFLSRKIDSKIGLLASFSLLLLMDIFTYTPYVIRFLLIGFFALFAGKNKGLNNLYEKKLWFILLLFLPFYYFFADFWSAQLIFFALIFSCMDFLMKKTKICQNCLIILGQFSLFLYFFHIILIKIISKYLLTNNLWILGGIIIGIILICWLLTKVFIYFLNKSPIFKRIFYFIFR